MRLSPFIAALTIVTTVISPSTHSALIDQGNGTVLDTDRNIYWMSDAGYAATTLTDALVTEIINQVGSIDGHQLTNNDFPTNYLGIYHGSMSWWGAMAWAEHLEFAGYDDWRLPVILDPDPSCHTWNNSPNPYPVGYCTGSEFGHLFYDELGGEEDQSLTGNVDPFQNISYLEYWTGSEHEPLDSAYYFYFDYGTSDAVPGKAAGHMVWVVRDATAAPIPPAFYLFGSGLLGLIGIARRKKAT